MGKGDSEKEAKQKEREKKADEKNLHRFEKLKRYAKEKSETDPDFRDQVEQSYEELMREHSQRAYDRNVSRRSYIKIVHEDSWRMHEGLYDNLLVQDHVNRLGQRLVPPNSERAYAFKVIPDPTPLAETLATGTIYISTGLISMMENEAQLAYVLAHEMAHVSLDHWRDRVLLQEGANEQAEAQQKKARTIGILGAVAGAGLGGAFGGSFSETASGALLGGAAGMLAGSLLHRPLIVAWDKVQEDQADELAFKALLESTFDVREVPKLYVAMERLTTRDRRVGLGFMGDRNRITERKARAGELIDKTYKAEIDAMMAKGVKLASAEHQNLMAELKRDNGIMAYYHDMFDMARKNLRDSLDTRDNDPAAHYFYGKVMQLVGRTEEDLQIARESFAKATQTDKHKQNYGSHLHLALLLSRQRDFDRKQVAHAIDTYVKTYAERMMFMGAMSAFPPNLDSMFEYMTLYGDPGWTPALPNISEKDLERYRMMQAIGNMTSAEVQINRGPSEKPSVAANKEESPRPTSVAGQVMGAAGAAAGTGGSRTSQIIGAAVQTGNEIQRNRQATKSTGKK